MGCTGSSNSSQSMSSEMCRCPAARALQSLCCADLKILVTKVPRGASTSQASLSDSSTKADWLYASLAHAPPTLGAPSWITASIRLPPASFLMACTAGSSDQSTSEQCLVHVASAVFSPCFAQLAQLLTIAAAHTLHVLPVFASLRGLLQLQEANPCTSSNSQNMYRTWQGSTADPSASI